MFCHQSNLVHDNRKKYLCKSAPCKKIIIRNPNIKKLMIPSDLSLSMWNCTFDEEIIYQFFRRLSTRCQKWIFFTTFGNGSKNMLKLLISAQKTRIILVDLQNSLRQLIMDEFEILRHLIKEDRSICRFDAIHLVSNRSLSTLII